MNCKKTLTAILTVGAIALGGCAMNRDIGYRENIQFSINHESKFGDSKIQYNLEDGDPCFKHITVTYTAMDSNGKPVSVKKKFDTNEDGKLSVYTITINEYQKIYMKRLNYYGEEQKVFDAAEEEFKKHYDAAVKIGESKGIAVEEGKRLYNEQAVQKMLKEGNSQLIR